MKKFLATILFLIFGIYLNPVKIQANAEFRTDLTTTYRVEPNGVTRVTHAFKITNQTPTTFIKQYALTTGNPDVSDVKVTQYGQSISPNVVKTDKQSSIAFDFPDEIVGEGKKRQFEVSYSNKDLATVGGKVLEIHIPKLGDPELYDSHTIILQTPMEFGEPIRSQPQPDNTVNNGGNKETYFTNVLGQSVSVYFGSEQFYNLTLRYNLENPGSATALAQIALPPETSFQELFYHNIDPVPEKIEPDEDGNWIATFRIPAKTTQQVFATAIAKTTLVPNQRVPVFQPTSRHTSADNFWEINSSEIQAKSIDLNTPKQIYDYVVEALNYTQNPIDGIPVRKGAVQALKNPNSAVCQEFSDVFIAMSRAKKIPARRLTGYAYSQNDYLRPVSLLADILHAWPEYYDESKKLWIPVDPTWEDTTGGIDYFSQFDLNHIVFAINGVSSESPYPAGSYKLSDQNSRDIEVSFTDSFPVTNPDFKIWTEQSKVFGIPLPGFYQLYISNQTGQAWYNMSGSTIISDSSVKLKPIEIGTILPFTIKRIPFTLNTSNLQIKTNTQIGISLNNQQNEQQLYSTQLTGLTAGPSILGSVTEPKILVSLAVFGILGTLIAGSLLVFKRKKRRPLRR